MSETKQNYDGLCQVRDIVYFHSNLRLVDKLEEISYSESARPLFRGLNNDSSSATVTATKIISGQDNST